MHFPSVAVTAVDCKNPLCRIDAVPRHRVIKENSLRHFLNSLLSSDGSWGSDRSVSPEAFMKMAEARDNHRLATHDALSAEDRRWRLAQARHYNHLTCAVKVVIIGNSGVGKTSLRGQVRTVNWPFIRVSR
jgi:hypothetical protein